jgi:hypothetical protein
MLEQKQIKQEDEAMDNSVSNIQLTPEAKRIIEGEIAYQTSGQGFWIGVFVYGFLIVAMSLALLCALGLCLYIAWRGELAALAWAVVPAVFLIIPVSFLGYVRRALNSRRG